MINTLPFPIRSNNSLDFFSFSRMRSISTIARTCLSTIAAFMISRQFLSTVVKRLSLKGNFFTDPQLLFLLV